MNLNFRAKLYNKIEKKRGNPLIVFVTSQRNGAIGLMAGDVMDEFMDQINLLSGDNKSVDLLIESTGGDALVAWRIISLLRLKFKKVNILVPHSAFSAATILALGGDEIVMGQYGSLGPIDPQIIVRQKDGTTKRFSYEDIAAFLDFTKKEVGLTEQVYIDSAFKILCNTVEPSALGFANRASSLSITLGEKLLQTHMTDPESKIKARSIAIRLNKSFFSHGHSLNRKQAKEIGLKVVEPDKEIERTMWSIHQSFQEELNSRKPFNPISEFLSHSDAGIYLQPPPPLNIPPGVDNRMVFQILQQYIQERLNISTPNVVREVKYAFLESTKLASEYFRKMRILVSRAPNLNFIGSAVTLDEGWRKVPFSGEAENSSVEEEDSGEEDNA